MVNTKEIPPEAILLGVYLELQNGESQASGRSRFFLPLVYLKNLLKWSCEENFVLLT